MLPEFKSIIDLLNRFPDEKSCTDYLELVRWNGDVVSPFDAESKVYRCKEGRYRCKNTGRYFNVKTGSIYEGMQLPMQKVFLAIFLITSHKRGISSHQLAKDLHVTQKTAWFLLHRLRENFAHPSYKMAMDGIVEMDETLVGGREGNKHANRKHAKKYDVGSSPDGGKATVFGMLQRSDTVVVERPHKLDPAKTVKEKVVLVPSRVMAGVVPDRTMFTLHPIVSNAVKPYATVVTDDHGGYSGLYGRYNHLTVNHSAKQFVEGMAWTNGIESFWSHMKRGINGIYYWCSKHLLTSYINEYECRFNTRNLSTCARFTMILGNFAPRLTYATLKSRRLVYEARNPLPPLRPKKDEGHTYKNND